MQITAETCLQSPWVKSLEGIEYRTLPKLSGRRDILIYFGDVDRLALYAIPDLNLEKLIDFHSMPDIAKVRPSLFLVSKIEDFGIPCMRHVWLDGVRWVSQEYSISEYSRFSSGINLFRKIVKEN